MLQIVLPLALVPSSIAVSVLSVSMGLVSLPVTVVLVTIDMVEDSLTVCFVVLPVTFVSGSIWPCLGTHSVSHVVLPLSLVSGFVLKLVLGPLIAVSKIFFFTLLADSVPVLFGVGHAKVVLVSKASKIVSSNGRGLIGAHALRHLTVLLVIPHLVLLLELIVLVSVVLRLRVLATELILSNVLVNLREGISYLPPNSITPGPGLKLDN